MPMHSYNYSVAACIIMQSNDNEQDLMHFTFDSVWVMSGNIVAVLAVGRGRIFVVTSHAAPLFQTLLCINCYIILSFS